MKKYTRISAALACATSTLLSPAASQAAEPTEKNNQQPELSPRKGWLDGWAIDSAFLLYTEPGRVSAVEPVITARRTTDFGNILTLKGAIDVLTGASGTGAVATDSPQTFTRPSGIGSYVVDAGDTPLDDTFKDTRIAISVDWDAEISRTLRYGLGASFSGEYDYRSLGINGRLIKEFNQKNTAVSLSMSVANDTLNPVGGVPEALQQISAANYGSRTKDEKKTVTDVLLGVTQIIDSRSLFQLNYGLTASSGYHNDPYKLVSLVDANGRPFDTSATIPSVIYENRPDSRTRHSFFGRYKRRLGSGNILDASYRLTTDDWGINSHTLDTKYRWVLSDRQYLQARLRYYTQSAADFYQPFLLQGQAIPAFASADYRVGKMNAITVGLEYGWGQLATPWRVAIEYYMQRPSEPAGKFGELLNQELAPPVNALMLRLNKTF